MDRIHLRFAVFAPLLISACTLSRLATPEPQPSPIAAQASPTMPIPLATVLRTDSATPAFTPSASATALTAPFCADRRVLDIIDQLETAVRTSDGELLASLVSPEHGMDARLFRDGRVVNYDRAHAAALFESAFALNWGNAPGSGLETRGSFQELMVPDLLDVLSREYEVACNQIRLGGATYTATWPYPGIEFMSVHFSGTDAYAGLDWHTWVFGMHYVDRHPFLYAMMQFRWEP